MNGWLRAQLAVQVARIEAQRAAVNQPLESEALKEVMLMVQQPPVSGDDYADSY